MSKTNKGSEKLNLTGKVVEGCGEGRYYISLEGYQSQFIDKLGFKPYAGTLNVKITDESVKALDEINVSSYIRINGFDHSGKSFFGAYCVKAEVNGYEGALIFPDKSRYGKDIVEVISPKKLRGSINEDDVEIKVKL
ncbi:MAG: CTP-dependent Riboflavin kinase [Candidatus Methanohalarchaeum thermophilum]|uniref:Riboflavin kinase n=1 Tax=Methanohalarchaeum thermophilum TaxID=1903181 RepID=A0A1Q6DV66_METT1|nr:MAG: CTP-dependent Riboflavin kinase [Candidatus Methanohalarchaeum thermophilum]